MLNSTFEDFFKKNIASIFLYKGRWRLAEANGGKSKVFYSVFKGRNIFEIDYQIFFSFLYNLDQHYL